MSETTKEQLQAEIEQTREQLGETVEELAARADVKARLHEKVEERKAAVKSGPVVPIAVGVVAVVAVALVIRRATR